MAFGLTQQAWPGASEDVRRAIALPYVLYRGPWLRIDRGAFGLRAVKKSDFELDIGFSGSLGARSKDSPARLGMPSWARWWSSGRGAAGIWERPRPVASGAWNCRCGVSSM